MTTPNRRDVTRVVRPLTEKESLRLNEARKAAEVDRDEIIREGRVHKVAWSSMRCDVDQLIAELRETRQRLGLSLADVEKRSGIRRSTLARLENDRTSNPTVLTLQRYAAALGLSLRTVVSQPST